MSAESLAETEDELRVVGHPVGCPRRVEGQLQLDLLDARHLERGAVDVLGDQWARRAAHRREAVEHLRLRPLHLDLVHETEVDDVHPELGVLDLAERFENVVLAGHATSVDMEAKPSPQMTRNSGWAGFTKEAPCGDSLHSWPRSPPLPSRRRPCWPRPTPAAPASRASPARTWELALPASSARPTASLREPSTSTPELPARNRSRTATRTPSRSTTWPASSSRSTRQDDCGVRRCARAPADTSASTDGFRAFAGSLALREDDLLGALPEEA